MRHGFRDGLRPGRDRLGPDAAPEGNEEGRCGEISAGLIFLSLNLGNMTGADGASYSRAQGSFSAIEDVFDAVRKANASAARSYDIYGHSAGAQFVHRLVWFLFSALWVKPRTAPSPRTARCPHWNARRRARWQAAN